MDKAKKELLSLPKGFVPPHILAGLKESSSVLVAFSGGSDSTALLYMMSQCAKAYGFSLFAAHLNHSIRGEEADRDERFCKELCQKLGVTFFSKKADVPKIAKETKQSVETAARDTRYAFFDEIMRDHSIPMLVTAHNANDNLETMIFNISRGCGIEGICGIPVCRQFGDAIIVRPILQMSKREILAYCEENSLSFVTDSTNTDTEYTRNKIREKIIPVLEEINPEATRSASRLSVNLKADSLYLQSMTDRFLDDLDENGSIAADKICTAPDAISSRAVMSVYKSVSGGASLEYTHIEDVKRLCKSAVPHSSIDLPGKIKAQIENGRLYFKKDDGNRASYSATFSRELHNGNNMISEINCEIFIGSSQSDINIYKTSILLYLDSDKINGTLFARNRLAGDKILSGKHHKDVRKLMNEAKIPLELRSRMPVICDDSGIIAVPKCAVRDGAKANEKTNNILCVNIIFN